jgi:hypothetical protein
MTEHDIKREREQQFRDSCTFKPALNPKSIKIAEEVGRPSIEQVAEAGHRSYVTMYFYY